MTASRGATSSREEPVTSDFVTASCCPGHALSEAPAVDTVGPTAGWLRRGGRGGAGACPPPSGGPRRLQRDGEAGSHGLEWPLGVGVLKPAHHLTQRVLTIPREPNLRELRGWKVTRCPRSAVARWHRLALRAGPASCLFPSRGHVPRHFTQISSPLSGASGWLSSPSPPAEAQPPGDKAKMPSQEGPCGGPGPRLRGGLCPRSAPRRGSALCPGPALPTLVPAGPGAAVGPSLRGPRAPGLLSQSVGPLCWMSREARGPASPARFHSIPGTRGAGALSHCPLTGGGPRPTDPPGLRKLVRAERVTGLTGGECFPAGPGGGLPAPLRPHGPPGSARSSRPAGPAGVCWPASAVRMRERRRRRAARAPGVADGGRGRGPGRQMTGSSSRMNVGLKPRCSPNGSRGQSKGDVGGTPSLPWGPPLPGDAGRTSG